jgi:hypothetical protein
MQDPSCPLSTLHEPVALLGGAEVVEVTKVDCSGYVQHWMSAAPGQWPASEVPPPFWQAVVEMQFPFMPELTVQVVEGGGVALVVEDCSG